MKYTAVVGLAARHTLRKRADIAGRLFFHAILLLVFSQLWSVLATERSLPFGAAGFIWYLALTEVIALGVPMFYLTIDDDVRRGDIAYRLAQPGSYVWMKIAEGYGETLVRVALLSVSAVGCGLLFTGGLPDNPRGLLLAIPVVPLAAAVALLLQAVVGMAAFWLQESTPLYWIMQKLLFVFGGLLFPLEIYPQWLRSFCAWTPFAPIFHGCGSLAFSYDPAAAALTALRLLGWGALLVVLVHWLYRRGLRILDVNGG